MQSNFYTFSMRYGIWIGLLIAINFVCSISSNLFLTSLSWVAWVSIVILLYYFTIRYRKEACDDKLTYGQGVAFVLMMYVFGAMVATALRIIYLKWINPDVLNDFYNQTMLAIDQVKMPDKSAVKDVLAVYLQPIKFSFLYLWIDFFAGLFYSLVIAAFTRSKVQKGESADNQSGNDDIVG